MKFKMGFYASAAFSLICFVQAAAAHHADSAFDRRSPQTLAGTVKQFRWTNPHTWLYLDVPKDGGGHDEWVLEGASVSVLARNGWRRTSINAGDKVKVLVAPRKDGKAGGQFLSVTMTATGQVLQWGII